MYELNNDTARIEFQWSVGDTRALEKNLREAIRPAGAYAITVGSRLIAYALTMLVAFTLLPGADFHVVLWIALAASFSIWISVGVEVLSLRTLEKLQASDPKMVGWNYLWLDSYGVSWSTEVAEDYTSWLGVIDIEERDGSFWIKTGPAHGYYIPPRIFPSAGDVADFRKLVQQLRDDPSPPRQLVEAGENLVKH